MSEHLSIQDFELFKDAMIEENLVVQIEIVRKLELLARALGEKCTREELLPFIETNIDLHDEILYNLSDQLKTFIPLVGGYEHSKVVFDLLAKLCNTDENIVREKAVETLKSIGQELNSQQTEDLFLPVLNKLINDDWFTSKCSAVMLYSTFYPKLNDEKKAELRNSFKTLIQDDSPMVRKAAALACVNFVDCIEVEFVKSEFVPIFRDIAQDPMDSVRSVTIDIAIALAKRLGEGEFDDSIFKTVEMASDDPSWRLRQRLANGIAFLQLNIPSGKYRGRLMALFQKLTEDIQAEVRIIAASASFIYCQYLLDSYLKTPQYENNFEPVFEQSIMPVIHRLADDENDDVRLALSSSILSFSTLLSENCFKRNIVSLLLEVLEREESMAIQANFLQGLSNLSPEVDLTRSLNAIRNAIRTVIIQSKSNWRIRRNILITIVDVTKFCSAEYFSDHFKIFYATLLGDAVFAVRRSASLILPVLSKHYGIKWASANLVPYFTMFTRDSRYLYRFVPLFGISEMINPFLCSKNESYLDGYRKYIKDKESVTNKKTLLVLARVLKLCGWIENELQGNVFSNMLKLRNDINYYSNCDTLIYCEKSFHTLQERFKNVNIYSVESSDFDKNHKPYLYGLLSLIFVKFLPIVDSLNKDVTENIQIHAICTLGEISDFIQKLKKATLEPWVQESLNELPPEEWTLIENELEMDLKSSTLEDECDKIDPTVMDTTDLSDTLNLSETISIDNSNNSVPEQDTQCDKNKNNDDCLVKEALDMLDLYIEDV